MKTVRVALAGNPNTGKSSIFNRLTGSCAHEGNYAGVTVDLCCGSRSCGDWRFEFVDLPGQYSLTPTSADEAVAVRYLLRTPPDIVLDVVDATNLERNLQLTMQLARLGLRMVIALNMCDEAEAAERMPDIRILSDRLGVPVIRTIGRTGEGMEALALALAGAASSETVPRPYILGGDADEEISSIAGLLSSGAIAGSGLASMLIEGNEEAAALVMESDPARVDRILSRAAAAAGRLESLYGDPASLVMTGLRRGVASGLVMEAVGPPRRRSSEPGLTRRIDSFMLNRFLGFPVFAVMMYLAFWLTFRASAPAEGLISSLLDMLASGIRAWLPDGALQSLLADGIVGGVGGVLLYVPGMAVLFFLISLMEDTGYMARAAFLTDGLMHRVGLHGRSFIPMLLGFGCTVPAVLAARTLEDRRDRLATILVLPLLSCGARLPVYLLVIRAFFPGHEPIALALIYGLGIALALFAAKILRRTLLKGDDSPFVMELPPYRFPTIRALSRHVWGRVGHYLAKAGTVILAFSVFLWLISYFPRPVEGADPAESLEFSLGGRIGYSLEPVLEPLGFDWRIGTAMIGAMGAKELFVSQMGILCSLGRGDSPGEMDLAAGMTARYSPGTGVAIILFILISAPCLATVAVVKRETGSWLMALAQYGSLTVLAWIMAFIAKTIIG